MLFPGDERLTHCLPMLERSTMLCRWAEKTFERFDEVVASDGIVV